VATSPSREVGDLEGEGEQSQNWLTGLRNPAPKLGNTFQELKWQ